MFVSVNRTGFAPNAPVEINVQPPVCDRLVEVIILYVWPEGPLMVNWKLPPRTGSGIRALGVLVFAV
jgi:hypothetical protein